MLSRIASSSEPWPRPCGLAEGTHAESDVVVLEAAFRDFYEQYGSRRKWTPLQRARVNDARGREYVRRRLAFWFAY